MTLRPDRSAPAAAPENPTRGAGASHLAEKALEDEIRVDPGIIVADLLIQILGPEVPKRNGLESGRSLANPGVFPRCRP